MYIKAREIMEEFIYSGKVRDSFFYFYDINGNETNKINEIVAKEISNNDKSEYYVRVSAMNPVHHSTFNKASEIINPSFSKVPKDIFEKYIKYLETKKEGYFTLVKQEMRSAGIL